MFRPSRSLTFNLWCASLFTASITLLTISCIDQGGTVEKKTKEGADHHPPATGTGTGLNAQRTDCVPGVGINTGPLSRTGTSPVTITATSLGFVETEISGETPDDLDDERHFSLDDHDHDDDHTHTATATTTSLAATGTSTSAATAIQTQGLIGTGTASLPSTGASPQTQNQAANPCFPGRPTGSAVGTATATTASATATDAGHEHDHDH